MKSCLKLNATMVSNEFIDKYMAGANGEYVKVYLYILRHEGRGLDVGQIADDLNHTESDVKRAVGYWVRQGVLEEEKGFGSGEKGFQKADIPEKAGMPQGASFLSDKSMVPDKRGSGLNRTAVPEEKGNSNYGRIPLTAGAEGGNGEGALPASRQQQLPPSQGTKENAVPAQAKQPLTARKTYTPEQVSRLAGQEDFTQLLYISQKYMDKIFTPRECEVFAYLYDALHMSAEVLEYLVEYCVQNGHSSIRYLESVAINWHEKGIETVDEAKGYTAAFSKEGFAVMRAFGISDRRPGDSEQEMIRKWFREFGFTKEIVLEACSRTLKAIHKPSFSYADKILTDWKKGGVRIMADIQKMDQQRDSKRGNKAGVPVKPSKNQFHNFEQRNTNYDAMVLERLKERLGDS